MLKKKKKNRLRKSVKTAGATVLESKERVLHFRLGKKGKG
jgi:hypothetical protein